MSDGWSDRKNRSICNFLVNIPKGTIFLASIDTSDISKTKEKVFTMLDDFVEKIGEEHVVQVVTDNAANYKAAGEMLMDKRKKLFWTPCAAHCIDLMLEDFKKKIEEHKVTIAKGRKVVSFIYNRTRLICLLKEFSNGKELLRPGATRKRKEEDLETFHFEDVDYDDEWITEEDEDLTNVYENESTTHSDSGDDDFLEEAIRNQYGGNEQSREESIYVFEEENEVESMTQLEIID
nr:SCAN domain-containing protein [Tanacetum cinerariifolium]